MPIIGSHGSPTSPLGLGTDTQSHPANDAAHILLAALDAGINLVDTSNSYSQGQSEEITGQTLKQSKRRHEVILATKAYYPVGPDVNDQGNN
ncbi:MAG: aldo/keto reductase [Saprospiraceae bacterium]